MENFTILSNILLELKTDFLNFFFVTKIVSHLRHPDVMSQNRDTSTFQRTEQLTRTWDLCN